MTFSQNLNPTFPYQPQTSRVNIAHADAQTLKTGYTAGANGSKILGIIATSTDVSNRDVTVYITNTGTSYPLGTTTVTAAAGTSAATAPINLLSNIAGLPVDNDANKFFFLVSGDTLQFEALTTVTSADLVTIHVIGTDF
jgi:hypothetical protein